MKKISLFLTVLLCLYLFPLTSGAEQPSEQIVNFEDFQLGSNVSFADSWLFAGATLPDLTEIKEEDGNHYLQLQNKSETDVDQNSMVYTKKIFTADTLMLGLRFRKTVDSGDMKLYFRSATGGQFPLVQFAGNELIILKNNVGAATGKWIELTCLINYESEASSTVTLQVNGYETQTSVIPWDVKTSDFRMQIVQNKNISSLDLDDIFIAHPPVLTLLEEGEQTLPVNTALHITTNSQAAPTPEHFTLNGQEGLINEIQATENGYTLLLNHPLEKNTEYVLSVSGYTNAHGMPPEKKEFTFRTRNTSLVWETGNDMEFQVKNLGSQTEQAVIMAAFYDQACMVDLKWNILSLEGGENYTASFPGAGAVMLMESLSSGHPYEIWPAVQSSALESDEFSLKYDETAFQLQAQGKIASKKAGTPVLIRILHPDKTLSDLSNENQETWKNAVSFIGCALSGPDGAFSFSYEPTGRSGIYTAIVTEEDASKSYEGQQYLVSRTDIHTLCQQLVLSKTIEDIETLLTQYNEILHVDFPLYTEMEDKTPVYAYLLQRVQTGYLYHTAQEIISDIKQAALTDRINHSEADDIQKLLDEYEEIIHFKDIPVYSVWIDFTQEQQKEVLSRCVGKNYLGLPLFLEDIQQQILFLFIENAQQYNTVKQALETWPELLGLDLTKYNAHGKPSYVAKQMVQKKYTEQKELAAAFEGYLQAYIDSQNKSNGSGGSGGTGGGSSSSKKGTSVQLVDVPKISPEPLPVESDQETFSDLHLASWAQEPVNALQEGGIINGYEDGTFRPNEPVTREQFLKMLLEYLDLEDRTAQCDFDDVEQDSWYQPYVATGKSLGIINGTSQRIFGVGEIITRQDMAVMLCSAMEKAGIPLPEGTMNAADQSEIASYAYEAVGKLTAAGIINGMEDGSFCPLEPCTRAQAATVIYRIGEVK